MPPTWRSASGGLGDDSGMVDLHRCQQQDGAGQCHRGADLPTTTADLSSLADGRRSNSLLSVSDPAGNHFITAPAANNGDARTRDANEHPSMSVKRRGSATIFGRRMPPTWRSASAGPGSRRQRGTVDLHRCQQQDGAGQCHRGGRPTTTADLSSLADGRDQLVAVGPATWRAITSAPSALRLTLEQKLGEHPSVLVNGDSATILTADCHPRGVSALPGVGVRRQRDGGPSPMPTTRRCRSMSPGGRPTTRPT